MHSPTVRLDGPCGNGIWRNHERPVLFTQGELAGKGLNDFGAVGESVKILQNQNGRTVVARQRVDGPDGCQRVTSEPIGVTVLAGDLQSLLNVPSGKPPLFIATKLGDFGKSIFVFVGLDPKPGETS
jgi:hypothetical protein